MRYILGIMSFSIFCGIVSGSAIPMWEFLSRGEKMSHLFNMFVKQVEDHCDQSTMPDCNKVLMVYGLTNLAKMDDDSLDKMDPYQRGAQDIIWESMMKGSYRNGSGLKTESAHDFYAQGVEAMEPELNEGTNGLGTQEDASSSPNGASAIGSRYVIGPMVVRVLPDGSPVPGDAERPLPRDEDAEEFHLMRSKPLPSLDDLNSRQKQHTSTHNRMRLQQQQQPQQQHRHDVHDERRDRFYPESSTNPAAFRGPAYQSQPFGRYPQLSASQPHAKFALPPPGMNFRIPPQ